MYIHIHMYIYIYRERESERERERERESQQVAREGGREGELWVPLGDPYCLQ